MVALFVFTLDFFGGWVGGLSKKSFTRQMKISSIYVALLLKDKANHVTFNHTNPNFNDHEKKSFLKTMWEKEKNAGNQHFSPFSTMSCTLSNTNLNFSLTFILSSVIALNVD